MSEDRARPCLPLVVRPTVNKVEQGRSYQEEDGTNHQANDQYISVAINHSAPRVKTDLRNLEPCNGVESTNEPFSLENAEKSYDVINMWHR